MATTISGAVTLAMTATMTTPLVLGSATLGSGVASMTVTAGPTAFTNGTGSGQANQIYWATRTLVASTSEQLDFNGSGGAILYDPAGNALTMARLKTVVVSAAPANTNSVVVGGGSGAVTGLFGGGTQTGIVVPGATLAWLCSPTDTTGYVATTHALQIANSGAGSSVTYTIVVIGTTT